MRCPLWSCIVSLAFCYVLPLCVCVRTAEKTIGNFTPHRLLALGLACCFLVRTHVLPDLDGRAGLLDRLEGVVDWNGSVNGSVMVTTPSAGHGGRVGDARSAALVACSAALAREASLLRFPFPCGVGGLLIYTYEFIFIYVYMYTPGYPSGPPLGVQTDRLSVCPFVCCPLPCWLKCNP